jgi:hypothetical protein
MLRWGKALLDFHVGAQLVEFGLAGGSAPAQAEQAVGELFAIVRKYGDALGAGGFGNGFLDGPWRHCAENIERARCRRMTRFCDA